MINYDIWLHVNSSVHLFPGIFCSAFESLESPLLNVEDVDLPWFYPSRLSNSSYVSFESLKL